MGDTSNKDQLEHFYSDTVEFSAIYDTNTEKVQVTTKSLLHETVKNTMFNIAEMQDRAILESLPNDVLLKLYRSIKIQIDQRGLLS